MRPAGFLVLLVCLAARAAFGSGMPSTKALDRADSLHHAHAFHDLQNFATDELTRLHAQGAGESLEFCEWLYRRGVARGELGDIHGSSEDHEACLAMRIRLEGVDSPHLVSSLLELGWIALAMNRFPAADSLTDRAVAIAASGTPPDSMQWGKALVARGDYWMGVGRPREAIASIERGLEVGSRAAGDEPGQVAFWLRSLGLALSGAGDDVRAEQTLRSARSQFESVYGPDDSWVGLLCNDLGMVLDSLGDLPAAKREYENALEITRKLQGESTISVGRMLFNVAAVSQRLGDQTEALDLARQALAIAVAVAGEGSLETRLPLQTIGLAEKNLGEIATAEADLRRAFDITLKQLGRGHVLAALDANVLAIFLMEQGRPGEALSLLDEFAPLLESNLGPRAGHTMNLQANRAIALLQSGRPRPAWTQAVRPCLTASEDFDAVLGAASERRALARAAWVRRYLDILLSAAMADPHLSPARRDSTFALLALCRGRVLDSLVDRNWMASLSAGTDSIAVRALRSHEDLADLVLRGPRGMPPAQYAEQLDRARWRKEDAEDALARSLAQYGAWRERRGTLSQIDLAGILDALPAGAAAVQYVRYQDVSTGRPAAVTAPGRDSRDVAIVIRKDEDGRVSDPPTLLKIGPSSRTDSLVAAYRLEIERTHPDPAAFRSVAQDLYGAIWSPAEPLVAGASIIFVLPAGPLHFVDYGTLVGPDGRYLIESLRLHRLTSLRDLVRIARAAPMSPAGALRKQALVVGDPDFDCKIVSGRPSSPVSPASARIDFLRAVPGCNSQPARASRLPGTAVELRLVESALRQTSGWGVERLTGADAREDRIKQSASGASLIHIASHGFFLSTSCPEDGDGPRESDLASRRGTSPSTGLPDAVREENPLLFSGILLAGCNAVLPPSPAHAFDDGRFTAEEFSLLDLRSADWVFLSACDTGLGVTDPYEGVLGLQRAIELAGARTSLLTLWKIPDTTMPSLASDIYSRRLAGASTCDAVRAAQLLALARSRSDLLTDHPRYWGGLVATGDWR